MNLLQFASLFAVLPGRELFCNNWHLLPRKHWPKLNLQTSGHGASLNKRFLGFLDYYAKKLNETEICLHCLPWGWRWGQHCWIWPWECWLNQVQDASYSKIFLYFYTGWFRINYVFRFSDTTRRITENIIIHSCSL